MTALGLPNGAPTSMSETGQPVTTFGNTPLTVSGGRIKHAPVPDAPAANVAGYMQSRTKTGGAVRLIWAIVQAGPGANTGLALVLPGAPWANGSLSPAEVHHVEYPSGSWHTSIWTGSSENKYLPDAYAGSWADGRPHLIAALVNERDGSVTIRHADGSLSVSAAGTIDVSKISEYGLIESYRYVNTTADPAVPIEILAWGLADASDLSKTWTIGLPSYTDVLRAIQGSAAPRPTSLQYRPTVEATFVAPTSPADVDATAMTVTFTAPQSGSVIVDIEAFVEITDANCHYLWDVSMKTNGNAAGTGLGLNRIHVGTCKETKRKRWVVTNLIPGATVVANWRHLATVASAAQIRAGQSNGYFASMVVTPA